MNEHFKTGVTWPETGTQRLGYHCFLWLSVSAKVRKGDRLPTKRFFWLVVFVGNEILTLQNGINGIKLTSSVGIINLKAPIRI